MVPCLGVPNQTVFRPLIDFACRPRSMVDECERVAGEHGGGGVVEFHRETFEL